MKRLLLFLVLLPLTRLATAQEAPVPAVTFDHLALSVTDVDRSAGFYQEIVNLPEMATPAELEGIRWFSLGEGKELHLVSTVAGEVVTNKAVHLALTTSDFDAFLQRLEARGIPFSDWPGTPNKVSLRPDGIRQIYFQDPDGYWIEMNSVRQKKE